MYVSRITSKFEFCSNFWGCSALYHSHSQFHPKDIHPSHHFPFIDSKFFSLDLSDFSLFDRYFHSFYLIEHSGIISIMEKLWRNTSSCFFIHSFILHLHKSKTSRIVLFFILRVSKHWNRFPAAVFPLSNKHSRIKKHH